MKMPQKYIVWSINSMSIQSETQNHQLTQNFCFIEKFEVKHILSKTDASKGTDDLVFFRTDGRKQQRTDRIYIKCPFHGEGKTS